MDINHFGFFTRHIDPLVFPSFTKPNNNYQLLYNKQSIPQYHVNVSSLWDNTYSMLYQQRNIPVLNLNFNIVDAVIDIASVAVIGIAIYLI